MSLLQDATPPLVSLDAAQLLKVKTTKCDLYFGAQLSKTHKELFAYLLASCRQGHLYVEVLSDGMHPSWGPLDPLLKEQALSIEHSAVVKEHNRLYLKRNHLIIKKFFHHLKRLESSEIETCQANLPENLTEEQKEVIKVVFDQPVTWICGGPGTGKSHTAICLIKSFSGRALVVAPTGKATANLRHKLSSDITVKTIHAVLAQNEIVGADLVIIDEGSMVDAATYAQFFSRIKSGARLAIFGDRHQLPPISSGHLFAECAAKQPTLLTKCLRTDLRQIIEMAEAIKQGKMVPTAPLVEDFACKGVTILTPLRQGPFGVEALNRKLFAQDASGKVPIIITQNTPELDLYNGDVGWLYQDEAYFPYKTLARSQLPPYELAYALSVHKSQGSEYDDVLILLPEGSERFGKEMLYTAVTRARKSVAILAAEGVLEKLLTTSCQRLGSLSS